MNDPYSQLIQRLSEARRQYEEPVKWVVHPRFMQALCRPVREFSATCEPDSIMNIPVEVKVDADFDFRLITDLTPE